MKIEHKIEEIRKKPEHIRMRYVFFCVGASMIIIFIVFILTVRQNFSNGINEEDPEVKGVSDEFRSITQELKEVYEKNDSGLDSRAEGIFENDRELFVDPNDGKFNVPVEPKIEEQIDRPQGDSKSITELNENVLPVLPIE